MKTLDDMVAQAISDPGSITARLSDGEQVNRWAARAVMEILQVAIGVDPDANYPGTPASKALMENGALRDRLRVADELLHNANGIIASAENFKMELNCVSSHCVQGEHVKDLDHPVPIGDQDWRDAAMVWAAVWRSFTDAGSPAGWLGPDEGDIKLPPPPPPPPPRDDLYDMQQAIRFCAGLLRTELGPGGLMLGTSQASLDVWALAINVLESSAGIPMIPLYKWRQLVASEVSEYRQLGLVVLADAKEPGDCARCDGLDGTHTMRDCVGAR